MGNGIKFLCILTSIATFRFRWIETAMVRKGRLITNNDFDNKLTSGH